MSHKQYHRVTFVFEGKRYERKGKTLAEAHAKAAELRLSLERGEIGVSGNMTVKRWAEEWLETYKKPVIGQGQYRNYISIFQNVIFPEIGQMPINKVKPVQLQKILNSREGLSKSHLSKIKNALGAIFQKAVQNGIVNKNPAEFLVLPASKDGTHRSITPTERKYILELAQTHYAGLWVQMMLYCGLRPNETRALDWRHIDFDAKVIHIVCAMKAGSNEIGPPKSVAGVRDVPIPAVFEGVLWDNHGDPFAPVFVQSTTRKRHTNESMRGLWKSFKRDLDILMGATVYRNEIKIHAVDMDLVPYCLRHTYCTDLQDAGVPINVARYLMGHSSIELTSRIYTHTTDVTIEAAREKINANVSIELAQKIKNA